MQFSWSPLACFWLSLMIHAEYNMGGTHDLRLVIGIMLAFLL